MVVHPPLTYLYRTRRLRLRPVREADAEALSALMSPPISARLASWPPAMSVAAMRARIRDHQGEAGRALVMEWPEKGALCGWVGVAVAEHLPSTGILTYWLGERFQRLGLMREAAGPAVAWLMAALRLCHLRAAVQVENGASLSVLVALGMRLAEVGQIWCPARGREEACLWLQLEAAEALAFGKGCAKEFLPADVAKPVDAADFNWSARGETRGVEPLKFGER